MPPLALAATVAVVSWMVRAPHTVPRPAQEPPAVVEADAGPFLALRPLERIALEPGSTVVTTEFPRALLADWGLPVSPDRAGEPVRAEMLYSATASRSPCASSTDNPNTGSDTMKNTLLATLVAALVAAPSQARALAPIPLDEEAAAFAHIHIARPTRRTRPSNWRRWGEDFAAEMRTSMGTMFSARVGSSRVVKGAPYSAEVITEINQTLGDGNVISKKTTGAVYRDGEGRTRQESGPTGKESIYHHRSGGGQADRARARHQARDHHPAHVLERRAEGQGRQDQGQDGDAQAGRRDRRHRGAHRGRQGVRERKEREAAAGNVVVKSAHGKEVKVENGKVLIDGKEIEVPGAPGVSTRVSRYDSDDGTTREEVRVQVIRVGDGGGDFAVAPLPPIPPTPRSPAAPCSRRSRRCRRCPGCRASASKASGKLGKGVTTQLGTKDFDGVKSDGRSTVWTIPAGQVGNRKPDQHHLRELVRRPTCR